MIYNFSDFDKKWQKYWEDNETFKTDVYDFSKPKYYVLDMFPYPSGEGLHVGHVEGYTATDIVARFKRMQGFNVLHPIGYDAFGLPAEQYAIKTNNHPAQFTNKNIANFRRQLKSLGFSYDYSKEVSTADPSYYHWTQWIFSRLFQKDLAYVASIPVNFCPSLGTVLANEEVIDGKSEVGGFPVIRLPMRQWLLKITAYAERLLSEVEPLDWPLSTREMQKNWIGKSEGTAITFKVVDSSESFNVFTTRVDTLYGVTYAVLAPEHPLVKVLVSAAESKEVSEYVEKSARKSDLERSELAKDKTGVFLGAYALHPLTGGHIPLYVGDYVLGSYGEGAVMAVPAHDERDYAFAKKYNLPIIQVLEGDISEEAFTGDSLHINSPLINGLSISESKKVLNDYLVKQGLGYVKTNYKLRDWLFSRQRYWGEPIPIIIDENENYHILADKDLPLVLPNLDNYKPSGTGEPPLAKATDWVSTTYKGKSAKRETNTMPQWAGSCWYYLRYLDPKNDKAIADPELIKHWLPVDLYIGGAEHAVGHLLYARFWHKFLYDEGVVYTPEPFKKLFHQGMILGENGEKMSKSRGNVVNPDDIIAEYGVDTLRLYEMFMGPLEASLPWSNGGLEGAYRFLNRVARIFGDDFPTPIVDTNSGELDYIYHYTVKKVTEDYESLSFNTAIAQMMVFVNEVYKAKEIYSPYLQGFVKLLYPIVPHLGEELYQSFNLSETITYEAWPKYDEAKVIKNEIEIGIQINGKLRSTLKAALDEKSDVLEKIALADETIIRFIGDKAVKRVIVVPNRIVNIVIG